MQREETQLADAVMERGVGGEDGRWMGVTSAANEVKRQHAMKAFQLFSSATASDECQ